MEYTCRIEIDVPREQVLALMTDGERAHEWMPGLESYRAVEGERGQAGSTSELRFANMPGAPEGGAVMIEKVQRRDEGHYDVVYLLGPVRNENRNSFTELPADEARPAGGTLWVAEHVFVFPPGMEQGLGEQGRAAFQANTQGSLATFKEWCERAAREQGTTALPSAGGRRDPGQIASGQIASGRGATEQGPQA